MGRSGEGRSRELDRRVFYQTHGMPVQGYRDTVHYYKNRCTASPRSLNMAHTYPGSRKSSEDPPHDEQRLKMLYDL